MKPVTTFFCILLTFYSLAVYGQDTEEIIKIETTLVSVPVIVSDRNGRYIPNLAADNFSVFQDGKKQKISFFASTEDPLNVAVLLDTSLSTREVISDIKRAAVEFVYQLSPLDRASIITFDSEVNVIHRLTSNRIELERAIRSVDIGYYPGTVMRDAVLEAAQNALLESNGRKAIIILTDGKDFGSYESPAGLLNTLEESDVLIYSIFYKTEMENLNRPRNRRVRRNFPGRNQRRDRMRDRQERMNKEAEQFLKQMSTLTAGRFYKNKISDLRKTFVTITSELRNQYRLGYYPDTTSISGSVHRIKVKVDREKIAVRARSTYRTK